MTVIFRIVEGECPPIPERFAQLLASLLRECFRKDPTERPSAEELFEHEWLKNHWGLNKVSKNGAIIVWPLFPARIRADCPQDLRPQDSIPFLRRVSADLQKNDAARHLFANLDLVDPPLPEFVRASADDVVLSSSPGCRSFVSASASPAVPELPQADPNCFDMREHTFVKTTFSECTFFLSCSATGGGGACN
jgi:serine/threonine protein kinase